MLDIQKTSIIKSLFVSLSNESGLKVLSAVEQGSDYQYNQTDLARAVQGIPTDIQNHVKRFVAANIIKADKRPRGVYFAINRNNYDVLKKFIDTF